MMSELDYSDLIGEPYEEHGRGPAYDCFGLWMEINRRIGITVPDYGQIITELSLNINQKAIDLKCNFIVVERPQNGDLVLMKSETCNTDHVGVIVEPGSFLHVLKKDGVIRASLNHIFWKNRIEGIYRYVG